MELLSIAFFDSVASFSAHFSSVVGTEHLDILESSNLSVYMDGFLKKLRSVNMRASAAVFFKNISLDLGVRVSGLMSSTLAKLQTITLAFECVLSNSLVGIYSDNQAVLNACKSELGLIYLDFRNYCWDLSISWHKVWSHLGVINNKYANAFANAASLSPWYLILCVNEHYILANGNVVSGNFRHFVHKIGSGSRVSDNSLHLDVDWFRSSLVRSTAGVHTYFMKALHYWLLVAVWKQFNNRCYPSVLCLYCGEVEISDHAFSCTVDNSVHCYLLDAHATAWSLLSVHSASSSSVSQLLSSCASNVIVCTALYKGFVFKDWLQKAVFVFGDAKIAGQKIVKFVHNLCLAFRDKIWLQININNITEKRPKTSAKTKFKVATTPDTTTLEYYQSIYTHCKQRFNIPDGIEIVKKSVYQYIENCINNYLFGNYNISEVRSNLYNNLAHYSQLRTEDLNSEILVTYFHELNYNIIKYCEETYPVQSQYTIDFELETETSNKGKNKLKQYSRTTPNTPTLPKTTAKHLQTPKQGTSSKLPLTITPFLASLAQAQTPNSPLNRFARSEDFTSLRSPTRQQELLQTSSNLLDFLAENQSEHSETAANKENNSEITKEESIDSENEEDEMTTYITKIPEFNGEDIETSPQEWLDQVTKAGDANGWNAARMLRTIPYFLKGTAGEWFENLAAPFNDWNAFKAAFLEQFTNNNTSITLRNCFRNIKQEPSKSVMTYIGKFNKLLRRIHQLETNDYYSDAQILDQFITGLKDKLIKKVCPHVPEDLNSAIQHAKRYEMAMEEANCTKLVNLAIREPSSAAEEKIDQLTKKVKNYFTNQQQQQQPQRYQPPQR
ncbi:hypothetical protein G9A89_016532 [Geosiphon pyriformis]|nr:hypothetical protein G9A89_016532 [Geosiphon pyriformis]